MPSTRERIVQPLSTTDRKPIARPLGRAETFFWFMGQANCGNGAIMAEIAGELSADRLRDALESAQRRHPFLRACILRRGLRLVLELAERPAPIPLQEGSLEGWREEVGRQMDRPFQASVLPLFRCFRFPGDGPKTVVALVFSHVVCDGRSSISLLREILEGATTPVQPPPRPPREMRAPMEQVIPAPSRWLGARFLLRRTLDWMRRGIPHRVPRSRDVTFRRRDVRILSARIDPEPSAALLEHCRAERTTVNGALAAALLLAIRDEHPGGRAATLAIASPVDLRSRSSLAPDEVGNYIGHVVTVHRVRPATSFWELAREFNAELRSYTDAGHSQGTWLALPPSWSPLPLWLWARYMCGLARLQPPSVMLTNAGRVADWELQGSAELRQLSFGLSPIFRDSLALCALSLHGALQMNLVHAATALPPDQAKNLMERVQATLLRMARPAEP